MACSDCSRGRSSVVAWCSTPPPWKTCAASRSSTSRPSKSSTTQRESEHDAERDMNVILPRYAGAIAESVVNEPVEVDVAVDEVPASAPAINTAATKAD